MSGHPVTDAIFGGSPSQAPPGGLVVRTVSAIAPEPVEPLFGGRLIYGKLAALGGNAGVGKSYLTLAVAAAVSTGGTLPGDDAPAGPADVLLVSYEDDAADTIRPRLETLGANLARVHVIDGVRGPEGKPRPFAAADVALLDAELRARKRVRLVIVDPVSAFVGGGVDEHRNNEIRAALEGLRLMAAERDLAVLLVIHLRKAAASNALARLSGSGAYGQLVRSALLAGRDPDDERVCAVAHIKHNLTARQPTLGYRISDSGFQWLGEVDDLDGERLAGHDPGDRRSQLEAAKALLREVLAKGPQKATDIEATAQASDLTWSTVKRAKKALGVDAQRHGFGPGSYVTWSLTVTENTDDPHRDHRDPTHNGGLYGADDLYGATDSDGGRRAPPDAAPCPACGAPPAPGGIRHVPECPDGQALAALRARSASGELPWP